MLRRNLRNILDAIARLRCPFAEIDILEPDWIVRFVQASQPLPYISSKHEKRARRLLYQASLVKIAIKMAIAAIDRIRSATDRFNSKQVRTRTSAVWESGEW